MNKIMGLIANKIKDIFRERPALKVGCVSVWGSFTTDEKERLRHLLLDSQIAKVKDQKLEERIAELEKRLATPVRLPDPYQTSCGADELYLCPVEVADAIRAAGFTVRDISRCMNLS